MTTCPDDIELAKAISTADPAFTAHAATCTSCRASWERTLRAIDVARQREAPMPTASEREEMRTALLAKVRSDASLPADSPVVVGRQRRARWIGATMVAAAAAITLVRFARSDKPAHGHIHGSVRGVGGASYTTATTSPNELVALYEGTIDVEVAPLHAGERFRVLLADAEVEVHGTAFLATARAGHLINVTVRHGIVEVRPFGALPRRLTAGEAWSAPASESISATVVDASIVPPTPSPNAPPTSEPSHADSPSKPHAENDTSGAKPRRPEPVAPPSAPSSTQRKPYEVAYDHAWTSMRAGDFSTAAVAFVRVSLLDPDGPLAEDASFWNAVALERGKESAQAADAFRLFIAHFPRSPRIGEANAMLGWILVDAHEPAEAARRFRAALTDPTPAIRESAQVGLDAVGKAN
jgi:hypothetical protein